MKVDPKTGEKVFPKSDEKKEKKEKKK